tara:strand:- start:2341 stop:2610 length:270 start_codon:yes stop_codon:yes gene_type:complete
MSLISDAILETVLGAITDYEVIEFTNDQYLELETICDQWEDRDSIESEINGMLIKAGYVYKAEQFRWDKPCKDCKCTQENYVCDICTHV